MGRGNKKKCESTPEQTVSRAQGILIDTYESEWGEVTSTGDMCKYHNHPEAVRVDPGENEHVVGFHMWDSDNDVWLVARSLSEDKEIKEMIVTGNSYMKVFSFRKYMEYLRMFNRVHAILSDEKSKPIVLSVDGIDISLMIEDGNKHVTKEAINWNLFREYAALKTRLYNDFQQGRYLVLKGVVSMIKFDPVNGDMKAKMSKDEEEYWKNIEDDIVEGGKLLYKFDGMNGMRDPLVWTFIPKMLHRFVDKNFHGIGEWRS